MKSVSGKYLCKILEQHGWHLQRISGSHYIYEKDGVEAIAVVPVHANRDMRIGTLKTILRATGLTEQDL
jgi:predicted RNA binding protein YcfA (HicA-like mRNA interferase family)